MDPLSHRVAGRFAKQFGSPEALKNYLRSHPKADKSKHTVAPQKGTKKPDKDPKTWTKKERDDYTRDLRKKMDAWEVLDDKKKLSPKEKDYGKQVQKVQDYWKEHNRPPPDTNEYKIPGLKAAYSYER